MSLERGKREKRKRSRISGYEYPHSVTIRLGDYEKAMLDKLVNVWNCSVSEAVRRCIVYTFSKYVAKVNDLSEESLIKALSMALDGLLERA